MFKRNTKWIWYQESWWNSRW